jgi:hypothetical protein
MHSSGVPVVRRSDGGLGTVSGVLLSGGGAGMARLGWCKDTTGVVQQQQQQM